MDTSKSKLQIRTGKQSKVTIGAPTSSDKKSPLMPKKDYKKNNANEMGMPSFGDTGMTGES